MSYFSPCAHVEQEEKSWKNRLLRKVDLAAGVFIPCTPYALTSWFFKVSVSSVISFACRLVCASTDRKSSAKWMAVRDSTSPIFKFQIDFVPILEILAAFNRILPSTHQHLTNNKMQSSSSAQAGQRRQVCDLADTRGAVQKTHQVLVSSSQHPQTPDSIPFPVSLCPSQARSFHL